MHRLTQNPLKICIRSPRLRAAGVTLALSAAFFASQMFSGGQAFAQEACGDQTCPKGFTCETSDAVCDLSCRVPESGEGCEPTPCAAQAVQYCAPAPCNADADCAEGMKCAEHETSNCAGSTAAAPADPADPTCPPDYDCGDGNLDRPAPECTPETVKMCTPRWQLPCETASDCGAGFTCDEHISCSSPGCERKEGDADVACSTEATCEPSGTFYCAVVETACTSDASCEAGWTCRDNPSGDCTSSSDGQTSCTTPDPAKLCTPPYTDLPGGGGRAALAENTGAVVDTDALASEEDSVNANDASASTAGGCSINTAPTKTSGSGFSLVGFAAAWALLRRRRADKASAINP